MGGLPGHKPGSFRGRIYDEDDQLAFIEPGHFVTFALTPGRHVFSITPWTTEHAKNGSHVNVDLIANQHYYIETSITLSLAWLGTATLHVDQVTCEDSQGVAAKYKPLEPVHLRPAGVPIALPEVSFPHCP